MNNRSSCLGILFALMGCGHHSMSDPSSIPITPITTDAVYIVNGGESSISVIDATTDEIAGTIELVDVDYPHHIYLSPDRSTLLVALPGADLSGGHSSGGHGDHDAGGAVLALEATTGALKAARRLDAPNHNAIYAPDGASVWTSQMTMPGQVLILDASTLATRSSISVGDGPSEVTFDRSGAYVFVANTGSDSVSIVDAASTAVLGTVPVGGAPVGAWPGSDGRMYVDNETGKSISVIDPATRSVVSTLPLGFTPALAAIAPNGDLWVTDTDNGKLVFFDAASGAKLGELTTGTGAHAFAFSASGAKAYVTNQLAGTVTVVDTAARTILKTITVGAKPNGILFRPR
jgi:YVTN family beta-propeller protein